MGLMLPGRTVTGRRQYASLHGVLYHAKNNMHIYTYRYKYILQLFLLKLMIELTPLGLV